ncbi:MAG TPA: choice-of-anchor tandem repeat GloVer-containing protein, partial [Chthoniobacterales bacterium]|nr:choice-of-anchor tandem repeat GloVer-containing protein [Chthoniobacterales bacterium]
MRSHRFLSAVLVLVVSFVCASTRAQVTYEILAKGGTNGPGARPKGGLVLGPDGNYYGTTTEGGEFNGGTVFRLTPQGVLTRVASFSYEEGGPEKGLTVGADGKLYGTTRGAFAGTPNSRGTVFRVSLAGELTILATFPNDNPPVRPQRLIQASDGNLYGTTTLAGSQNRGSVFRVEPNGSVITLVSFTGPNGAGPEGGLVEGSDGDLYGTTAGGGVNGLGTVFRMTKAGVLTTVASFTSFSTGYNPEAELIQTSNGNFYGVTQSGGGDDGTATSARGTVFSVTPAGVLSRLARLPDTFSGSKSPLVIGTDGNFYGTTADHFYRVTPAGQLTVLVAFNSKFDGRNAGVPLLKAADGGFLGTTSGGGTTGLNEFGTVHRLTEDGVATTFVTFPKVLGTGFNSELTQGADGLLYGTVRDSRSRSGFSFNAIPGPFRLTTSGAATPLSTFRTSSALDSGAVSSRLVPVGTGDLFGTISNGGQIVGNPGFPIRNPSGFIYRIRPTGSVSTVYQFEGIGNPGDAPNEHGERPYGALTPGPDGQFYGTTSFGGAASRGTFFKIDAAGTLTTLASFNEASGRVPHADLIFSDGLFYGVTAAGGDNNTGTFFTATAEGQITRVISLPPDSYLSGRLILAADGKFYGPFSGGGANNIGRIFRLTKVGELSTFASMDADTGAIPRGIMQASDGNFYGVTDPFDGPGSIFRVEPNGAVTALVKFSEDKGLNPRANLMQASDGHLYGTTSSGGPSRSGVVYRLRILPPKQLLNISTRLRVQTGENVLIGGFIVSGSQPKKVIVRALGPSLQGKGVSGALANPVLELRGAGGALIASNDDWRTTQAAEIQDSGVPPENDLEAAIVATLQPG